MVWAFGATATTTLPFQGSSTRWNPPAQFTKACTLSGRTIWPRLCSIAFSPV